MIVDPGQAPRENTPDPNRERAWRQVMGMPDPKPPARIVDIDAIVRFRREAPQVCVICRNTRITAFLLTVHHIVPKSQGGDDVEENFTLICGHGTVGCHGDVEEYRHEARETLRERFSEAQVGYVLRKKGEAWLDRHYPLRDAPGDSLREAS